MTTNSIDEVIVTPAAPKAPAERMAWVKGNKVRGWIMLSPDDADTFVHPDGGRIVTEAKGQTLPFEPYVTDEDLERDRRARQVDAVTTGADAIKADRDTLAAIPTATRTAEQRMLLRVQRQVLRLSRLANGLADDAGADE